MPTLDFSNCKNDNDKRISICQYIDKNSITPDQFLKIFKSANFTDDADKRISIYVYMKKANSIPYDKFLEILENANFTNDTQKEAVIESFFKQEDTAINFLDNIKKFNITVHHMGLIGDFLDMKVLN